MTTKTASTSYRDLRFGLKVDRPTATVPTSAADQTLFTISGGRVAVLLIVGEVTTVIGGTTPSAKLTAVPSSGSAVDLCTAVAITSDAVGNLYGISTLGGALTVLESATSVPTAGFVVRPGSIKLNISAADATGAIKWTAFWVPVDDAGKLVAA